jgi:hypothetical protein
MFEAQIAGLKEQIAAVEQRLRLAADKAGIAGQAQDELTKRIQILDTAIAAKADSATLSELAAKVNDGFARLATANNALSSPLSINSRSAVSVSTEVLRATEAPPSN